jgi:hypothetical protein
MSTTPRTDAERFDPVCYYDIGGEGYGQMKKREDGDYVPVELAFELERENAALRKDKARLDWLDHNAVIRKRTLAIMERDGEVLRWAGVEWSGGEPDDTLRAAVDAAMEGDK